LSNAIISFPLLGLTLNPTRYFEIFGFKIYWYGVIIAAGFLLAAIYCFRRSKDFDVTDDNFLEMLICAVPAAIICGRLYFVIFYDSGGDPNPYFQDPSQIFRIRDGGIAIYGAVIGAVLAAFIYAKIRKRAKFTNLVDLSALGLLVGQAIGRWGNYVNREVFGYETTVPWRMGLTVGDTTIYVHPTFLYESLWNVAGFLLLHFYFRNGRRKYSGQVFLAYLGWYGLGRFFIEGIRTDSLLIGGLPVSQLLAAFCVVGAVLIHLIMRRRIRNGAQEKASGTDETEAK